jgi:hypothetical protein
VTQALGLLGRTIFFVEPLLGIEPVGQASDIAP